MIARIASGYPAGPRATPLVADGKLYTLGAMGDLLCLNAEDGKILWEHHFIKDYELADPPTWGWAAHPLLDGERLICVVGGSNSVVVAFNKDTGREIWRALTAPETGYAPPQIQTIAGKRQLIIWHPDALAGLEPETGKVLWDAEISGYGEAAAAGSDDCDAARFRGSDLRDQLLPRVIADGDHEQSDGSANCLGPSQQERITF
jgi:outer membrane protein assembly factor BamB